MGCNQGNKFRRGIKRPTHMNRRSFIWKGLLALGGFLSGYGGLGSVPAGAASLTGRCTGGRNRRSRMALIIDDIGQSRARARQFLDLDVVLTFSILPHLPYSDQLAREMHGIGYEVMLHQPMEPYSAACDPGPGALFVGDGSRRIARVMEGNIRTLPQAVGVNNHMGSRFTESAEDIGAALKIVKKNGLFFVDSCTTNHSKARAMARSFDIPALSRRVFLDNVREESAVLRELYRVKRHALRKGRVVAIGHPFPETARAIRRFAMDADNTDIRLVSVSGLMQSP